MRDFAAVPVFHQREHVLAVRARIELRLRNTRKLAAENIGVRLGRRAERVEVHLLIEVEIRGRPLRSARVARVEESLAIGIPSHAPDRKSTRLNSSHMSISYAVFCL